MSEFYKLSACTLKGQPFPFTNLQNKVVLVLNTASSCGYAPQFKDLEELYQKYKDVGFEVIAFPSNQFKEESKSADGISNFCVKKFNTTFPILEVVNVNGPKTHPVFEHLKSKTTERKIRGLEKFVGYWLLGVRQGRNDIKWNFEKFLVDRQGNVVSRHESEKSPMEMEEEIEMLLKKMPV